MLALKTSKKISWSTISTAVFVVEINKEFAKRLLLYLTIFARSAVAGQNLTEFDIKYQAESVHLLLKAKELAIAHKPQYTFASIVEEIALKNIAQIVKEVDRFHKEKEGKKPPVICLVRNSCDHSLCWFSTLRKSKPVEGQVHLPCWGAN